MTNPHMQAAIEAGDDAYGKAFVIIGTIGDIRHHAMATALEAALPHLRAMIAQEIMAYLEDFSSKGLPYRDGIYAGIHSAANIAKGPQQ